MAIMAFSIGDTNVSEYTMKMLQDLDVMRINCEPAKMAMTWVGGCNKDLFHVSWQMEG